VNRAHERRDDIFVVAERATTVYIYPLDSEHLFADTTCRAQNHILITSKTQSFNTFYHNPSQVRSTFFVASPATPQSLTPILLIRVDDVDKSGLQAGATHQETINVLLLGELAAVLLTDASSVDDPRVLRRLGADGFGQPVTDRGVDFLCLFCGRKKESVKGLPVIEI
jgi:hypothetical protein